MINEATTSGRTRAVDGIGGVLVQTHWFQEIMFQNKCVGYDGF